MSREKSPSYIYRFRSCKALLDEWNELEKQQIYFATKDELNDPGEGIKDFNWKGDRVVWERFFRHFLLCFEYCCYSAVTETDFVFSPQNIAIGISDEDYVEIAPGFLDDLWNDFYTKSVISKYPEVLEGKERPLKRNEVQFLFKLIHSQAIRSTFKMYSKYKVTEPMFEEEIERRFGTVVLIRPEDLKENPLSLEGSEIFRFIREDANFARARKYRGSLPQLNLFLIVNFSNHYVDRIEELVYPAWCMASFVDDPHKVAMWAYYANNHKGVCLKFKTIEHQGHACLRVKRANEETPQPHKLWEVKYNNQFHEVDFFRSMGQLPMGVLDKFWYSDNKGNSSCCRDGIYSQKPDAHPKHWDLYYNSASRKLNGWMHENEYRIIFPKPLEKEDQKHEYDFHDLDGLIFGINTDDNDKIKIVDIIEKKCKERGRTEFKFYQAFIDSNTGSFRTRPMHVDKLCPIY